MTVEEKMNFICFVKNAFCKEIIISIEFNVKIICFFLILIILDST